MFDRDGNGSISAEELLQILKATHLATATQAIEKKAEAIMKQLDKDMDGQITFGMMPGV